MVGHLVDKKINLSRAFQLKIDKKTNDYYSRFR